MHIHSSIHTYTYISIFVYKYPVQQSYSSEHHLIGQNPGIEVNPIGQNPGIGTKRPHTPKVELHYRVPTPSERVLTTHPYPYGNEITSSPRLYTPSVYHKNNNDNSEKISTYKSGFEISVENEYIEELKNIENMEMKNTERLNIERIENMVIIKKRNYLDKSLEFVEDDLIGNHPYHFI
jgi:hypothetical protein